MRQRIAFARLLLLPVIAGCATTPAIVIDVSERHQVIAGFGGFGPSKVWWEKGPYFDERYLDLVIDDLGATIMRTQLYWDLEPSNDDADPATTNLTRFSYGPDSNNGKQLPFIRALKARGVSKLIASVWTPPVWMKRNADNSLAVFCKGECGGQLKAVFREELAEYIVTYIKLLKREAGVDLYAVSLQNEPLFANPFESCVYTADDLAQTIKTVGARFDREHIATRIFGPEHMGSYDGNKDAGLFDALLDDAKVSPHLDIYAVHGYVDGVAPDFGSAEGWSDLSARVQSAGKPLWMTETSGDVGTYDKAFEMTRGLHLALKEGNVAAWVYWYFSNSILDHGKPTSLFYLFKSYYRFVRPNSIRVGASSSEPTLLVTAFSESDALTVVVMNNSEHAVAASLSVTGGSTHGPMTGHRTSATEPFVPLGRVTPTSISFPARSVTTLISGTPGDEPEVTAPTAVHNGAHRTLACGCDLAGRQSSPRGLAAFVLLARLWCARCRRRQA